MTDPDLSPATRTGDGMASDASEPPSVGAPDEPSSGRRDLIFGTLQNERRRLILEYLRDHGATTRADLADHVAAVQNGVAPESLSSAQRKRVYVALYQSHLPKLADAGAIEYDRNRGTVDRTPETAAFLAYLGRLEASTRTPAGSRARRTLGAAALLAVVFPVTAGSGAGPGAVIGSALAFVLIGLASVLVVRRIGRDGDPTGPTAPRDQAGTR